jgi:hypothetical protein
MPVRFEMRVGRQRTRAAAHRSLRRRDHMLDVAQITNDQSGWAGHGVVVAAGWLAGLSEFRQLLSCRLDPAGPWLTTMAPCILPRLPPSGAPATLRQDASIIGMVGLAHASSHFSHLLLPLMFPVVHQGVRPQLCATRPADVGVLRRLRPGPGQCGFLVDRMGARPVLFASMAIFVLACVGAASATGYPHAAAGGGAGRPGQLTVPSGGLHHHEPARVGAAAGLCLQRARHHRQPGLGGGTGVFACISGLYDWRVAYLAAPRHVRAILLLLVLQRDKLHTVGSAAAMRSMAASTTWPS